MVRITSVSSEYSVIDLVNKLSDQELNSVIAEAE